MTSSLRDSTLSKALGQVLLHAHIFGFVKSLHLPPNSTAQYWAFFSLLLLHCIFSTFHARLHQGHGHMHGGEAGDWLRLCAKGNRNTSHCSETGFHLVLFLYLLLDSFILFSKVTEA